MIECQSSSLFVDFFIVVFEQALFPFPGLFAFSFSCSRLRFIMPLGTTTETNAAIVACLFCDYDARLGSKWLASTGAGLTDSSIHRFVNSNSILGIAKTRDMYGHFCTKTQMLGTEGTYYRPEPTDYLTVEMKRLNDLTASAAIRLQTLRTDDVGDILFVTQY
jgi:hypothetical protein